MSRKSSSPLTPQKLLIFYIGISVFMLAAALYFQFAERLAPCPLCLYQRWPYVGVIGLGLIAIAMPGLQSLLLRLIALLFAVNAAIALYHVGVEQHWWESAVCGGQPTPETIEDLLAVLEQTPVAACDAIPWQLFGISMAGYNGLISLALAVSVILATRPKSHKLRKKPRKASRR